ncbi:MAG: hypothetical protein IJG38_10790 [Thermoguttaceae bacterium]|nr:hypothetical protein [Thermoguttaceae bacterium]
MAASKNDFRNVSLQNLVDNPDCTDGDVAQWVQDNEELFVDESNPDEFSQDKVNKLFADLLNNNAVGGFGNLGIENTLNVDWFNIFGSPEPEEKEEPEQGWNIADAVLTMGKKILGMPGSAPAKKPVQKSSGGFGMGKIDLGTLLKYAGNSKLRKVYWVLKRVYNEIAKLWPSKRRRTTRRKTTAKKTTSRSRTTTAKKTTTSRSTTAKKTAAKKTPARTTAAKKTTAKKTTTRSTTAKKTR